MHPLLILIPAAALVVGPRIWVNQVLRQSNRKETAYPGSAAELARELLDNNQLQRVKVERTDLGDHYDPQTRTVRLARDKYDRNSLTAHTTAAHEVAHAIQHHGNYGPFIWRMRLGKVAQVTGEAGFVLLLSAPVAAMFNRQPLPPVVISAAALAMLGTGVAVQLVALPSELDASFRKALPMLQDGYIHSAQIGEARKILSACSLTYVTSSLVSVLHIWPWLGRGQGILPLQQTTGLDASIPAPSGKSSEQPVPEKRHQSRTLTPAHSGKMHSLLRTF
ncbi:MAG: zinc metallopeptidase, partial [Gammaproteobacteria bacterium]